MEKKEMGLKEALERLDRAFTDATNAAQPEPQKEPVPNVQVPPEEEATARGFILDEARHCVCRSREEEYGSPEDSFALIAELWSAYTGCGFEPKDVAVMMILLKTARIAGGSRNLDNWIDIAGYAACGGEIVGRRKE